MKNRHVLALVLLAGCGGGSVPEEKKPAAKPEVVEKVVDLETECREASLKWKTLRAVYKAEGATAAEVTLAIDRGAGRAVMRVEPGPGLALEGGWVAFRFNRPGGSAFTGRVPLGTICRAVDDVLAGRPVAARGEPPPLPFDRVTTDLALYADKEGRAGRHIMFDIGLAPGPTFSWLRFLQPADGNAIRAIDRNAVSTSSAGVIAIDRDTGALLEWTIEPPGGHSSRLRAATLEHDQPVDETLFRFAGEFASPAECRDVLRSLALSLAGQLVGRNPQHRFDSLAAFAHAWYRAAWSEADLDALADGARKKVKTLADKTRRDYPSASDDEITAVSSVAAREHIQDVIGLELELDLRMFAAVARPQSNDDVKTLQSLLEKAATEEVGRPVFERALKKPAK